MNWHLYEDQCRQQGFSLVCGIDEAGRGPLAGDVYAAAVILPLGLTIEGLNDSKKLSAKRRETLFDEIGEKAVSCAVATASVEEIEELNILQASFLAMRRAVAALQPAPDFALVDGNHAPGLEIPTLPIIKGDGLSLFIAAASVLAKVSRDRYMEELAKEYPQYQFDRHKGYPTKLHYQLLEEYGISPVHRKSFLKKWEARRHVQPHSAV